MGSPSLDPHPYIPLMLRAKTAGQWQRLAVDLKVAITNIHPRREEVPTLPYPNVYFFWWVFITGAQNFLCSRVVAPSTISISFWKSQFYEIM